MACGILVPGPGMEPTPPALEAWGINHWLTRKSNKMIILKQPHEQGNAVVLYMTEGDLRIGSISCICS